MKPTAQQITTASRLQELGVGQDSREWIIELKNGSFEFYDGNLSCFKFDPERAKYENCKQIVGPLPNAAECWSELLKIVADKFGEYGQQGIEYVMFYIKSNLLNQYADGVTNKTDLDEAFRQALITLAAQ